MANFTESPKLSEKYAKALQFAFAAHKNQVRKQGVPYISHLLSVSSLVLEAGGSEDEAIAALLHNCVEDVGVAAESLIVEYGYEVYSIVLSVTEKAGLSPDRQKQAYVDEVARDDVSHWQSVRLVSCADKLHNLRGYATNGRQLWKPETAKFYAQLMPIYEECYKIPEHWIEEMKKLLAGLAGSEDTLICILKSEYQELWEAAGEAMEWNREFRDS